MENTNSSIDFLPFFPSFSTDLCSLWQFDATPTGAEISTATAAHGSRYAGLALLGGVLP